MFCSGCPVYGCYSDCHVLASMHDSPGKVVLPWLSCSHGPVLAILFAVLYRASYPILNVPFRLSCLAILVLLWLSCTAILILLWLSCTGCLVLAALISWRSFVCRKLPNFYEILPSINITTTHLQLDKRKILERPHNMSAVNLGWNNVQLIP